MTFSSGAYWNTAQIAPHMPSVAATQRRIRLKWVFRFMSAPSESRATEFTVIDLEVAQNWEVISSRTLSPD